MNTIFIKGRLTKDPIIKQTKNNKKYTYITIAVDRDYSKEKKEEMKSKNQQTTDFINVMIWGKLAENVIRYTNKGLRIIVEGRLQSSYYLNENSERVYTSYVLAQKIDFLDWKKVPTNAEEKQNNTNIERERLNKQRIDNTNQIEENLSYDEDYDEYYEDFEDVNMNLQNDYI